MGHPHATEDDAERAVRAALELVDAVSALGDEVGSRARGACRRADRRGGRHDRRGRGRGWSPGTSSIRRRGSSPWHRPAPCTSARPPARASDAAIVYEEAGYHELKGKAEPSPLCRALRVVTGRGGTFDRALEPPFLGRDRELRMLKDLFHASGRGRKAHLVTVTGGAGIGKSRLVWEFFKYIDGLATITYWHRGRCLAYGEGVTFWALAEMVRTRLRIVEGEEPASALPKFRAAVGDGSRTRRRGGGSSPRLARLLGLETGPPVTARICSPHGGSSSSAGRREPDRARVRGHPLGGPRFSTSSNTSWSGRGAIRSSSLTAGRPELPEKRPSWGAGRRNSTSIYLEPLPPATMEELLTGSFPACRRPRAQILERAEGVPLYAVETVRMLLDRGPLRRRGPLPPTGPIDALEVPETLHALIAARLDGLSADERRLVQDASVLGKTFSKSRAGRS